MTANPSLVFLVHGILGHPEEFSPLVEYLNQAGFRTHTVCLPQHGDLPGLLSKTSWEHMLEQCESELKPYQDDSNRIHLIGFSLGGALSLLLSRRHPETFASLTLAASPCKPLFNADFAQYHAQYFFDRFLPGLRFWSQRETGHPKPGLDPLSLIRLYQQMPPFFNEVQAAASQISTPTLLLHSPYDLTVPYTHSEWLFETLPAKANFVTLLQGGHQIFPFQVNDVVQAAILNHLIQAEHHPAVTDTLAQTVPLIRSMRADAGSKSA